MGWSEQLAITIYMDFNILSYILFINYFMQKYQQRINIHAWKIFSQTWTTFSCAILRNDDLFARLSNGAKLKERESEKKATVGMNGFVEEFSRIFRCDIKKEWFDMQKIKQIGEVLFAD